MSKVFVYLGLLTSLITIVSCSTTAHTPQSSILSTPTDEVSKPNPSPTNTPIEISDTSWSTNPFPSTHEEKRFSQAPADTITATLNKSQFNNNSEFLLTISNSTRESIELVMSANKLCYEKTFWFYSKKTMGWQPIQPQLSFKCFPTLKEDIRIQIPAREEKEFNIGFLLHSRGLLSKYPAEYTLRVRYMNSSEQEYFLYTDNFQVGSNVSLHEPLVSVEYAGANDLNFNFTNASDQSLWIAPMCSSTQLASGWMDKLNSNLQHLTPEQAWLDIHSNIDDCSYYFEPIEIMAGETRTIDTLNWFQNANLSLESGSYRWDVVYFLNKIPLGVEKGRHAFTSVFEYRK